MTSIEAREVLTLFDRIKELSPNSRILRARRILEFLEAPSHEEALDQPPIEKRKRGVPSSVGLGLLRTHENPPSDEECHAIIEEER